jgi:hypothetical protein
MYDMNRGAFRAWLQSCGPQSVVGWATQETTCPVARWMGQLHHQAFRVAGSLVFLEGAPFGSFPAPVWVSCFVAELDDLYDQHSVSVSAESALAVLDGLVLEVADGSPC